MQRRCHATSRMVQRYVDHINQEAPINLEWVTLPACRVLVQHVELAESLYAKSRLFRWLLNIGIHPTILFVAVTTSLAVILRRAYRRSAALTLDILGVAYPAWRCWQLVKRPEASPDQAHPAWITYWILYGALKVLDHAASPLLFYFPNYRIYKALFLYWAQNPRSWGADLIHRHVLIKPPPATQAHSRSIPPPPSPARHTALSASLPELDTHWATSSTDYHHLGSRNSDSSESSDSHPHGSPTEQPKVYPPLVSSDLFGDHDSDVPRTILY